MREDGSWTCTAGGAGAPSLGEPGADAAGLAEAADVDLGLFAGFAEDLTVDEDGLVVRYPGLAVLVGPVEPA